MTCKTQVKNQSLKGKVSSLQDGSSCVQRLSSPHVSVAGSKLTKWKDNSKRECIVKSWILKSYCKSDKYSSVAMIPFSQKKDRRLQDFPYFNWLFSLEWSFLKAKHVGEPGGGLLVACGVGRPCQSSAEDPSYTEAERRQRSDTGRAAGNVNSLKFFKIL